MYAYMFEKDEERKKSMEETFKTVSLPNYLNNMQKILVARGGKFFAGNELTWAGIGAAMVLTNLKEKVGAEVLESHKELSQLNDMVNDLPNIKKYIKARPKTDI